MVDGGMLHYGNAAAGAALLAANAALLAENAALLAANPALLAANTAFLAANPALLTTYPAFLAAGAVLIDVRHAALRQCCGRYRIFGGGCRIESGRYGILHCGNVGGIRPYHIESTSFLLITEV